MYPSQPVGFVILQQVTPSIPQSSNLPILYSLLIVASSLVLYS